MSNWRFDRRWLSLLVGAGLLIFANYSATLFRIQPAVSLWFPPSGVSVVLALWFGPFAAIITGLVAVLVAPLWGSYGWTQWIGLTDAVEPLIAWWLYRFVLERSLIPSRVSDVIAFILSAPVFACLGSAVVGSLAQVFVGHLTWNATGQTILQWWLGNAIGVMTIVPVALLVLTPTLQRQGWLSPAAPAVTPPRLPHRQRYRLGAEKFAIFSLSLAIALLSVSRTSQTGFAFQQFAFLNFIPILWAALRLGIVGSTVTASFCVVAALLCYVLKYPLAIELSQFPIAPSILTVHKLSLLIQCIIGLLVGTAITQQTQTQIKLAISQLQLEEYKVRSQLSQELEQSNQALAQTNQQLERANQEKDELLKREQAARSQAEAANQLKDEFLAVVSHELRSPLNPILGWTKLLQAGKLDATMTQKALQTIHRNAELQSKLIGDLLDVSRILRGKLVLNEVVLNLAVLLQSTVEAMRLSAAAKAIDLTFIDWSDDLSNDLSDDLSRDRRRDPSPSGKIPDSELLIRGDPDRLQQVILNLLTNAIKFTPEEGQVQVVLERQWGSVSEQASSQASSTAESAQAPAQVYAQISVKDTGKGIDPAFLPHVFERFRQQDGSTTRAFGGLGLGLAIVRHLVELHHGTVTAQSAGENLGATFIVKLPTIQPPTIQPPTIQPPTIQRPTTQRPTTQLPTATPSIATTSTQISSPDRTATVGILKDLQVLVVDDDDDARELLQYILEMEQATVRLAASAQAAMTQIDIMPPDLIISDISMPDMDGYALMNDVRSQSSLKSQSILAIALTANAKVEDRQRAIAAGFNAHLTKPITPEALLAEINRLLHQ